MNIGWYIGIIIAILLIVWALNVLFRRPRFQEHLNNAPVETDPTTGSPILPRHRRQLDTPVSSVVTPTAPVTSNTTSMSSENNASTEKMSATPVLASATPLDSANSENSRTLLKEESLSGVEQKVNVQAEKTEISNSTAQGTEATNMERGLEIAPTDESTTLEAHEDILSQHLNEQEQQDKQSCLLQAEEMITLYIYPYKADLNHEKTMKLLKSYGLRFGEMSCFHRYEYQEQADPTLMFSVLKLDETASPAGFNLESKADEAVTGLAFFLSLPHQHAVKGFDMMASIAVTIANDIEGAVFDDNLSDFSPEVRNQWREYVISRS